MDDINEEYIGWAIAPFYGSDSSGSFGPNTMQDELEPMRWFSNDGVIDIVHYEFYDDPEIAPDGSWDTHTIIVTYELHIGACCYGEGYCDEVSEYNCIGNGGNYLGNEIICSAGGCDCTDPCGQPNCEQYDPCDTSCETYDPCLCNPWDGCEFDCTLEPPHSAFTIHCVPSEYSTIQEAIDAASEGDIIQVAPGNYGGFEIRKAVKVTGLRSTGVRPVIEAGSCLDVANGGVLEFMEITFGGFCSIPGYGMTDRGFTNKGTSGYSLGVIRDCISHNGGANIYGTYLELYDCQFLGEFETPAFAIIEHGSGPWVGGMEVNNSLICGSTGSLADGNYYACVNFNECLISAPTNGQVCLNDCSVFKECPPDCNENGVPDIWDIANGTSSDKDADGVPDECWFPDCNGNDIDDTEDVASGSSLDCDQNGVPDECQSDCDGDGWIDPCDNDSDVDGDGIPDNCEPDCNENTIPDDFEIEQGWTPDCNGNGIPDECDVGADPSIDCDQNGLVDSCELESDPTLDCDLDGILDSCTIDGGTVEDCNNNGIPDSCDLQDPANDQNQNGAIDYCECLADINNDDAVDVEDLLIIIGYWNSSIPNGDINFDGTVNIEDLLILIAAWGTCP